MDNVEYLLDLEKEAEKLSNAIREMYDEIGTYKDAKYDFHKVNNDLLLLVQKTDGLVVNSHAIIHKMNEIGMPEVLSRINNLENNVNNIKTELVQAMQESETKTGSKLLGIIKSNKISTILISVSVIFSIINLVLLFVV
jgi:tetrahydromethanopterin S-methyltransferase subunit G